MSVIACYDYVSPALDVYLGLCKLNYGACISCERMGAMDGCSDYAPKNY